ncbi:Vitamin B12 transporter BtuB [Paraburkholderia domus]|uniref:TonB-dependent receptor n=1 Tax=Paraburkholderia domus TaxID=2793075 RepID=UPI001913C330|nr:TonB-dependent receptor [Paraburkholderia domus]MBK5091252.1 TonB-dependent receptor [Burkholderia sp. R-69927]CAE6931791.1 Vitamin B12 transporter BtuB [Paraburkholderia domus]
MRLAVSLTLLAFALNANAQDKPSAPDTKSNTEGQAIDLGQVGATGGADADTDPNAPNAEAKTASAIAPTQSSLTATQPQTILNSHYIKNIAAPNSDYLAIAQFSPSVINAAPNGAGFSSKSATVRGFQDGQYNVTFDGIPFGDPSAFGHATTSFFPAAVLDHVIVDRGPGTASTVGNATFGGTVSLFSETPSQTAGGRLFSAIGTGAAWEEGGVLNSGVISQTGGTTAQINFDHTRTNGLLENAGFNRNNWAFKVEQPIGNNTVVTVFSSVSDTMWNTFSETTRKASNAFGKSYGNLNGDPTSQAFAGYNTDHRRSDFEYIGVQSDLGVVRIDNKVYTYALSDEGMGGVDPTLRTPNSALLAHGGVPGADVNSQYRSWGDIFKIEGDVGHGLTSTTIRAGAWLEHARINQFEQTVDLRTNTPEEFLTERGLGSIIYNNLAVSNTAQTFVEFDWKPLPGLTITPGYKHVEFNRSFEGTQNFLPLDTSASYSANLGSVTANYRIANPVSVYASWAMGFQAPPVSVLETLGAGQNTLAPQKTLNYQSGVVYKSDRLTADFDGYYINFGNMINSRLETVNGIPNQSVFFNQGGVIYKGIEAEATYEIGQGFAVTANGSLNSAKSKATLLTIANAPSATAAFGVLYDRGPFFGSLLTKYVGPRYTGSGEDPKNPNAKLPAYYYTDLVLGFRYKKLLNVQLLVDNLLNRRTATLGNGAAVDPTFYYLPVRNFTLQATVYF